jgi:hypothetical protein
MRWVFIVSLLFSIAETTLRHRLFIDDTRMSLLRQRAAEEKQDNAAPPWPSTGQAAGRRADRLGEQAEHGLGAGNQPAGKQFPAIHRKPDHQDQLGGPQDIFDRSPMAADVQPAWEMEAVEAVRQMKFHGSLQCFYRSGFSIGRNVRLCLDF